MPFSTSFGLNLFRGNNAEGIGSWGDDETEAKINLLSMDNLELEVNKIYQDKAVSFIKENPGKVLKNAFVKLFYFWVYYPDQRSLHPIYLIPSIFLLLFFLYGIVASFDWKENSFFYLFFIFSSLVVVIFFPMARYQTMMKAAMNPFCAYGINKITDYFGVRFGKRK